jgi:hypothetical protein
VNLRLLVVIVFVLACCSSPPRDTTIRAVEEDGKIVALEISKSIVAAPNDSTFVFLKGASDPVLGTFASESDFVLFTPAVHLSKGQVYEVRNGDNVLTSIELKVDNSIAEPKLVAVYPSGDTLAENTLKMYFRFSEPMVEGVSMKHVHLIRNDTDTMRGTFLDLQPELWNEDGTILTLWLDPGRIKRDLIPNKTLGNPLSVGSNYRLVVTEGWRSKASKPTSTKFEKRFVTTGRDETSPGPERWSVSAPKTGTIHPLKVAFGETLDYLVALNAIDVLSPVAEEIQGELTLEDHEQSIQFVPGKPWETGKYVLRIEARLEDPAGNNLSRLFDQDITNASENQVTKPVFLYFEVR